MLQLLALYWSFFCLNSLHKVIFGFYWIWLNYLFYYVGRVPHWWYFVWWFKLVIYILFVVFNSFWPCFLSVGVCFYSFGMVICKDMHTFRLNFFLSKSLKFRILTRCNFIFRILLHLWFLRNLLCYKKLNLLNMRWVAPHLIFPVYSFLTFEVTFNIWHKKIWIILWHNLFKSQPRLYCPKSIIRVLYFLLQKVRSIWTVLN